MQDLEPGTHVLICFVSGADDVPHFAKGMIAPMEVTEAPGEQPAAPESATTVTLADFSFGAPDTLPAGSGTVEVVNNGPQPHEMTVVKLNEGVTFEQFQELFTSEEPSEGQPPFTSAGGMGALPPNTSGFAQLDLEAGTYVLLCFVPDAESGSPHAQLGMLDSFTVE